MKSLSQSIEEIQEDMELDGQLLKTERWQGMDLSKIPGSEMVEILDVSLRASLHREESLKYYQDEIKPNLPWADDHFEERVCGYPINPGKEWQNWPWGDFAKGHMEFKKFNHNYMERYWPRYAGQIKQPTLSPNDFMVKSKGPLEHNRGIYHRYGDLKDLCEQLAFEPGTRQAYLPIWFPEDTGVAHSGRKPCTLGYHFIRRNDQLHVVYYIRSCDLHRHFRDDIYLTVRLLLWVLGKCRAMNPQAWESVKPGNFTMHITSLHMFINDYLVTYGCQPQGKFK